MEEVRLLRRRMDQLERRVDEALRSGRPRQEGWVATHVNGLDELMGGGLPRGHVILLHGPTGALKTSLALTFLGGHRDRGDRRLYISLEEDRESLQRTLEILDLPEADFIVDLATMRREHGFPEEGRDWIQILMTYLLTKLEAGLDLLVIDPLDALYAMSPFSLPRQELFQFFTFLREAGVTSLLLYEEPAFLHQEDRMADGVLEVVERPEEDGRVELLLRCSKLRHAPHSRDYHRLALREGALRVAPLSA